jgi:hypothetical protein
MHYEINFNKDALQKLEQAKKSTDYSNSVSVYWTQAQGS